MGILAKMLGVVPEEQPPQLISIFPAAAASRIHSGSLPTIQADKIILGSGEVCHFVDVGAAYTEKTRRQSVHVGGSYHIMKGYTAHLGQSQSVPVSEPHFTKGVLYITNQRVIFVAHEHGFDKKLKALTAVTPYSDGIALQFGSKSHMILLPDSLTAKLALDMLV